MTTEVVKEPRLEKEVATMGPPVNKRRRKRDNAKAKVNAPPKVLRKDHAPARHEQNVSDLEPLSYTKPHPYSQQVIAQSSRVSATEIPAGGMATTEVPGLFSAESPESKRSMSVPSVEGSLGAIYQPGWGVTNDCRLDTPEACQDIVDHTMPPGYFSKPRHLPNTEFLAQYNINLARQVALGFQLRLKFEQEVIPLKKARAQVVKTEVHGLRNQMKNLETLLEAEVDMKKATEAKNAKLAKELESFHAKFSDLQLNNNQLSQQVSTLQAQVTGEERIKAVFEEFKKYEDDKVEKRCRRWVIGHGLRLAVMKCAESIKLRRVFANVVSAGIAIGMSEGLEYGVKQGEAKLDLAAIEAYDPEADDKYIAVLHALKDLKYPLIDQLEKLKDAPLDLIMASLHLESDTGEDALQWILPTIAPQGLVILLVDAATQTDISEDEASPRLLRSKSLPPMYNLDWP
ncbi:hypothetical protein Tco_1540890 [Tanacetum coccineum]